MSKQPEALRLADDLDQWSHTTLDVHEAAAELRRLAAIEEQHGELLEACKIIVSAFDALKPDNPARYAPLQINAARAAIAKAEGKANENM
jgi:hypothetical protein